MNKLYEPLYGEKINQNNTLAALLIEEHNPISPITNFFDKVLVLIVEGSEGVSNHYVQEDNKIAEYYIEVSQFEKWIHNGAYPFLFYWILNGEIIYEKNSYLTNLKSTIDEFPHISRKKRIGLEFTKLIHSYIKGKDLYDSGEHLDAFNEMIHTLHYLGRLCLIDQGIHPEVTVWRQVKEIEPEIFKLYKELVEGKEDVEKRIELILLACGFAISKRTYIGGKHLLSIMEKSDSWSFEELMEEEDIQDYGLELSALLEYLIEKKLIQSDQVQQNKDCSQCIRRYKVIK